ncbi:hypothetical protein B2M27_26520 [Kluyvera intermedia]|uniref:DUF1983 domain-containing protein n=1 Tax=Kluyvera intermedia TaxID=61648 RepID=A0ABX3U750_KLUIN|nr:hypothetical protein [Kluyvera intermedia]ORJ47341.1 hypothetical protein B2M27_26520 [Kluyvera intermedia]
MNKELSGAAGDVLHALFFRGALVDGDLPSKAGAAELRELGYMKTQDTVTPYYNFLTPAGQEFAISYLVDSKFGKRPPRSVRELEIKTSIDSSELQSTIDEVLDSIRESNVFKVLSGQTFINDTVIKDGSIRAEWLLNIPNSDEKPSVVFKADCFKATVEVSASGGSTTQEHEQILRSANAIIEAAKAEHTRQEAMMADLASAQVAITESINKAVNDAIANALKPGGLLYARK